MLDLTALTTVGGDLSIVDLDDTTVLDLAAVPTVTGPARSRKSTWHEVPRLGAREQLLVFAAAQAGNAGDEARMTHLLDAALKQEPELALGKDLRAQGY